MIPVIYESNIGIMFFCENKPTLEEFVQHACVRAGSYAEQFATRLYWHLWGSVYDMQHDCLTYYKPEYLSFPDYLRRKHACTQDAIKVVCEQLALCPGRRVFLRVPRYVSADYNIEHLVSEYGLSLPATAKCLGMTVLRDSNDED